MTIADIARAVVPFGSIIAHWRCVPSCWYLAWYEVGIDFSDFSKSVRNVLISQRFVCTKNDFGWIFVLENYACVNDAALHFCDLSHEQLSSASGVRTAYCNRVPHVAEMLKKWMLCGDVMPFIATTSQSLWSNHERIALIYFTSIPMNEFHHAPHHISICIVIYSRSLSFIGLRWVDVRCVVTIAFCIDDDCNSRVHSVRMFLRSGKTYKYSIRQHTYSRHGA